MADAIGAGTIFIREDALLPEFVRFESEPYSSGWRSVKNLDGRGVSRKIREAGWTFFYMASEVRVSVFGFDAEMVVCRAVNRLLASLKGQKSNSLEITQVVAKRFLGLPYVTVSAHQRHIQEGIVLFQAKRRVEWDAGNLAAA